MDVQFMKNYYDLRDVYKRQAKDWLYVEQSKQNLQQDIPFPDVESDEDVYKRQVVLSRNAIIFPSNA